MNSANLHQSIYSRLAGYSALTSAVVGIYSSVPQPINSGNDAAFPFVTFSLPSVQPFDDKDSDGSETLVQIHLWTRTQSDLARRAIEDTIYACLHNFALSVASANTILCQFDGKTEFQDPDGKTIRGVMTFRVIMHDI